MDQVHSLHVGRYMYWSEVLCCTVTAQLRDIEVKVMSHLLAKHKSGELRCPATALIMYFLKHIHVVDKWNCLKNLRLVSTAP